MTRHQALTTLTRFATLAFFLSALLVGILPASHAAARELGPDGPTIHTTTDGVMARSFASALDQLIQQPQMTLSTVQTIKQVEPVEEPAVKRPPVPSAEERGHAALRAIGIDLHALGWTTTFHSQTSPTKGLTWPKKQLIEIWVGDMSDAHLRHVLAHEIGHAVDLTLLDQNDRNEWREHRRLPVDTSWWSPVESPLAYVDRCYADWTPWRRFGQASTTQFWNRSWCATGNR